MNTILTKSEAVTGNIGSCTTQVTSITTEFGIWKSKVKNIQTNSCTGQVTEYTTWSPEIGYALCLISAVIFIVIMLCTLPVIITGIREWVRDW